MNQNNCINNEINTSWDSCHIDIWFVIAKYLSPEDTIKFAQICKKTHFVTDSEAFWRSLFNRYIRSKYPWLDIPTSSVRTETIREMFKVYPTFCNRKLDSDSYDLAVNKICLNITQTLDEKLNIRSYTFKLQSKSKSFGRLAKQNRDEGCQMLLVKTRHFVPVPYESDNLQVKSIVKLLSKGLRSYKLKIKFCDQFSNLAGEELIFDPIVSVQLYDWWDPNYEKLLHNKS